VHLIDDILPPALWLGGYAGTAAAGAVAVRRLTPEQVPKVAVVTSAFVVASYVYVPLPLGTSVHLLMNGLVGILLGADALLAIVVALVVHMLAGQGGFQPLGFTALAVASGALLAHAIFHRMRSQDRPARTAAVGFLAGAAALYWSAFVIFLALWLSGDSLRDASRLFLIPHAGLAVVEGIVTAVVVSYLQRVQPSLLDGASGERSAFPVVVGHE
jgi:cobalt/nickel transport system permease protein